jgi:hypothetical protein
VISVLVHLLRLSFGWVKSYDNALRPVDKTGHEVVKEYDTGPDFKS